MKDYVYNKDSLSAVKKESNEVAGASRIAALKKLIKILLQLQPLQSNSSTGLLL